VTLFQIAEDRHVGVVLVDLLQLHLAAADFVVPVERGEMTVHRVDQIVVHRHGHVVWEQRGVQRTGKVAGAGIVDVALDGTGKRRGERILVGGELLIVLPECRLAHVAIWGVQQGGKRGMAQLDPLSLFVLDGAELKVGIVQLPEDLARGAGHFALHGQQLLFAVVQRVRLVTQHPLQHQPVGS
jgi:hypothetical protein